MSGVTNPAAGTYGNTTFSLATSKDVTAVVAPTAITIIATVSSVSFSGATQSAGTVTTWTVGFRSSVAGALATGDTITVAFNVNFVTPATPVIVLVTTLSNSGGACVHTANTVASLTIAGITNPLAGAYAAAGFTVATNRDNTAALSPAAITITSGVGSVTFVGTPLTTAVASSWTVGFTSGPSGALSAASTISVTFHPSFTIGTATVALAAGFSTCSATAGGSGAVISVTLASFGGTCALLANTAASLTVGGLTNPTNGTYAASAFTVATSAETTASAASVAVVIVAASLGGGGGGVVVVSGGGGGGSSAPAIGSPNSEMGLGSVATSGATSTIVSPTSITSIGVSSDDARLSVTAPIGAIPGGGSLWAGEVRDPDVLLRTAPLPSTAALVVGYVI